MNSSPRTLRIAVVTSEPIDQMALQHSVVTPRAGALVTFTGIVRNHDQGRSIRSLDYSAHPTAQRVIEECCARVAASSGLDVAAAHRIGSLQIGDVALFAAVAAAHRKQAFDACEELVETIKHTIPIWKRQWTTDGVSEWVGL